MSECKRVPVVATDAMIEAFQNIPLELDDVVATEAVFLGKVPGVTRFDEAGPYLQKREFAKRYAAMLAAAPEPAGGVDEAMVERAARALASSESHLTPDTIVVGIDNRPEPYWKSWEKPARTALQAARVGLSAGEREDELRLIAIQQALPLSAHPATYDAMERAINRLRRLTTATTQENGR